MKLFEITPAAKIVEPIMDGQDVPFVYLGTRFAALLIGSEMPAGTTGLVELDTDDPVIKEAVLSDMAKVSTPESHNVGQRVVYDALATPPVRRVGTPREFLRLFTDQEKAAFFGATRQNVEMEIWWAEASTGDFSLDHPSVKVGLGALVQSGLLSAIRMTEILAADFDAA